MKRKRMLNGVKEKKDQSRAPFYLLFFGLLFLTLSLLSFSSTYAQLADSPWPMFHGGLKLNGLSQYDTSHLDGSIKWRFKTEGQLSTSPAIGNDGTIYVVDEACNLYAVNPDGTEKWKFSGGEPVSSVEWGGLSCAQSSPSVAVDGTVYFLPMTGNLYAVNSQGKEKWRYPIFMFKNSWSSPTVGSDGTVYVGSESYPPAETKKSQEKPAYFYAINPDGTLQWEYDTGSSWINGTPSIADDKTIYTAGGYCEQLCKNVAYAFNPDGAVKWIFTPPNGVLEGSITIGSNDTLYFGAKGDDDPRNANFYALNSDGEELWKIKMSAGESITPALDKDENIYFGDWDGVFYSYDKNGNLRWKYETEKVYETLSSSPAIGSDGAIYFGSMTGDFFALTLNGVEKWKVNLSENGGIISSPAIAEDGTVYVGVMSGELIAFGKQEIAANNLLGQKIGGLNSQTIVFAVVSIILLLLVVLFLVFRIRTILTIILIILFVVCASLTVYLYLKNKDQESSGYTCPEELLVNDNNEYYIMDDGKERSMTNEEFNWIRENCKETKFPGTGEHSLGGEKDISTNEVGDSVDCPHHVYGTDQSGYYGAFGSQTRDLSDDDVSWVRENCPNATWPDAYKPVD